MKTDLCIAIYTLEPGWEAIMDQLGLWYEELNFEKNLRSSYSLIILTSKPDPKQKTLLNSYLSEGGAILELKDAISFNEKKKIHTRSVTTITNETNDVAFAHIPFIDLNASIQVHTDSDQFEGLVHISPYDKGNLGFIGADISSLMQDITYHRKRFYSPLGVHPDELVSQVSKYALQEVLLSVIKELHFQGTLPLLQKWHSPTLKPVFCFRIDSDFGDLISIQNLYKVISSYGVKATWFLHVQAHEDWLEVFKAFEEQELALHGYEHGTSINAQKVENNIQRGYELLHNAGIEASGFCAPYGIWNEALIEALGNYEFTYSSDFTYAYDGTPLHDPHPNLKLQIPIHPICTGSLARKKLNEDDMLSYFKDVMNHKLNRYEPVIFYHHPLQTGLKVWDELFKKVNTDQLTKLSFSQYAEFWLNRQKCSFSAAMNKQKLVIEHVSDAEQLMQVSSTHQQFKLGTMAQYLKGTATSHSFLPVNAYLPDHKQVSKLRKTDFSLIKTSLLDWKNRKRL